ncbi:Putative ERV/ALR sulfhydryl oxidase domain, sulfhydryl oxidase ALR/ERV [Septoria linicola]|uniref:Sulfhydryl oxidase n=1 Tax=Septoria linicola TaxID=215465 RepID=A0A9Q9B205_9PEZI|nr:Putative ERV/ALR sulfhydryl oxidase domain, sulfhydryl oxidase ALR/ERV [Septoria linicola]
MATRRYYTVLALLCIVIFVSMLTGMRSLRRTSDSDQPLQQTEDGALQLGQVSLTGHAIAPKLGNETAKAELGRATWKFFHTVMARFPENPTADESATLKTFIHSFQRVYPCGECAEHFGQLLKKFPPQVSSRNAAAGWACHVHNQVNLSLKKEIFDCNEIGDFYDCGCAEDEEKQKKEKQEDGSPRTTEIRDVSKKEKPEMSDEAKERLQFNGRDFNGDLVFS